MVYQIKHGRVLFVLQIIKFFLILHRDGKVKAFANLIFFLLSLISNAYTHSPPIIHDLIFRG